VFRRLHAADGSAFTVSPPRLRGPLPRLAQRLAVERLAACLDVRAPGCLTASLDACGALAEGFTGEPGSFIRRCAAAAVHTMCGFTYGPVPHLRCVCVLWHLNFL